MPPFACLVGVGLTTWAGCRASWPASIVTPRSERLSACLCPALRACRSASEEKSPTPRWEEIAGVGEWGGGEEYTGKDERAKEKIHLRGGSRVLSLDRPKCARKQRLLSEGFSPSGSGCMVWRKDSCDQKVLFCFFSSSDRRAITKGGGTSDAKGRRYENSTLQKV